MPCSCHARKTILEKEKSVLQKLKGIETERISLADRLETERKELYAITREKEMEKVVDFLKKEEGKEYMRKRVETDESQVVNDLMRSSHQRVEGKVQTLMRIRKEKCEASLNLRKTELETLLKHLSLEKETAELEDAYQPVLSEPETTLMNSQNRTSDQTIAPAKPREEDVLAASTLNQQNIVRSPVLESHKQDHRATGGGRISFPKYTPRSLSLMSPRYTSSLSRHQGSLA